MIAGGDEPMAEMLTPAEAAEYLRVSRGRLYDLVRQGLLPAVRLGRQIRIRRHDLREFCDAGGRALPGGWRRDGGS